MLKEKTSNILFLYENMKLYLFKLEIVNMQSMQGTNKLYIYTLYLYYY